jgi:ATP-dependent DNA helicase RecQ
MPPDAALSAAPADPALSLLRSVFGYPGFRGQQAEIIAHVVGGGDALVLMPTGGGKSLCYQIPALLRPGLFRTIAEVDRDWMPAIRRLVAAEEGRGKRVHRLAEIDALKEFSGG